MREFCRDIAQHQEIIALANRLNSSEGGLDGYHLDNGRVLYHNRMVVPRTSPWIPRLFQEFHTTAIGGHAGGLKTYQRMAAELYWVGMRKDVARMVAECVVCQRNKYSTLLPNGLLQPLELPDKVWDDITMDFIDGLPKSEGYTVILVVVDRLSKYAHFIPLRHPYTAITVAAAFLREVVRLHGIPQSILTDRDKVFLSTFWKELFRSQGTRLKRSTAYHPQTDGQTEVVNRSIETYLRCFTSESPRQWAKWLPWAEYWYNTSYHTAAQTTPFKVLYGREPPRIVHYNRSPTQFAEVDSYMEARDQILNDLKSHLLRSQQLMKKQADKHRQDVHFRVGDKVFLKLRPYRQKSVAQRRNEKLSSRYYGPYEVIERIGQVAYKLKLPEGAAIHPVFHVSQLKKVVGDQTALLELPKGLTSDMEVILQPETVEAIRPAADQSGGCEVLIRWKNLPGFEATWESYDVICEQFPDFHLEDKVGVWREGNDKDQRFGKVYRRKEKKTGGSARQQPK